MPQVPVYDGGNVAPTQNSNQPFTNNFSAGDGAAVGKQLEGFGDAMQKEGQAQSNIALDMAQQANELRVSDAMNSARQASLDATYGPNGYKTLKGKDALDRKDAEGNPIAMPDQYAGDLKKRMNEISGTLSNSMQQKLFNEQANGLLTTFHGDAQAHMLGEFKDYHKSVNDGAIQLAQQGAAAAGITNPAATKAYADQIKNAVAANQQLTGASANETVAEQDKQVSAIHAQAIESGLQNGDITGAAKWFNDNKKDMTGGDILKTQGQLNTKMDAYNAMHAVGQVQTAMASRFQPGAWDQLTNLVFSAESSGKQFGGPGSVAGPNAPTTSPKGAIGIAQVMPETAPEAAKLAGVPYDEVKYKTDGDYNMLLGKAYLNKQLQTFGDVKKALAAYNAGPGATQDAIAKAQKAGDPNWLQHMSAKTQAYVAKIGDAFDAGQGTLPPPTELEFVSAALDKSGSGSRMEAVAATSEFAKKQYGLLMDARKQEAEQAQGRVQAELNANGGSISQLSPASQADVQLMNRYDPSKAADILRYAKYAQSDDKQVTNIDAYSQALNHPDELAKMPDVQFQNFLKTNFSPSDQIKMATLRADVLNGTKNDTPGSINSKAIIDGVNNRLEVMGIATTGKSVTPAQKQQQAIAVSYIVNSIYDQQKQLGRKMTPSEINDYITDQFSQNVTIPGWSIPGANLTIFGVMGLAPHRNAKEKNMMTASVDDIPSKEKQAVLDTFTKHGITNPTPEMILDNWWKSRNALRK